MSRDSLEMAGTCDWRCGPGTVIGCHNLHKRLNNYHELTQPETVHFKMMDLYLIGAQKDGKFEIQSCVF